MATNNKAHTHTLTPLTFAAYAAFTTYILYINREVLYTAHERSEYLPGTPYLHTLLDQPFGPIQYLGAYLTQYLHNPTHGAAILITIWAATILIGTKALHLHQHATTIMLIPIACLLTSIVDTGYWIYILTIRGYWYSQTIAYLLTLLLLWAARTTPQPWRPIWYIITLTLYPILGWYTHLLTLTLILTHRPSWPERITLPLLLITPYIWHHTLYPNQRLSHTILAGLPIFTTPSDTTPHLTTPFYLLAALTLAIPPLSRHLNKWYTPILSLTAAITLTLTLMYHDKNYIDEMRILRHAQNDNWDTVLNIATQAPNPTISMIILKNVALMHKGTLLDQSFQTPNTPHPIHNPDTLHVSFLEIAAPIAYYNYGLINEAFRLNFECAVQAGLSPYYLKNLTRCALANGEHNLVQRYTTILHHHPAYTHYQPTPPTPLTHTLQHSYPDQLTGVENSDKYLINTLCQWHPTNSKKASEQALFYSMIRCDSRHFWPALRQYVKLHPDDNFPLHAQEAYILYLDKAPEQKRIILQVNQDIYNRYTQFWQDIQTLTQQHLTPTQIAQRLRPTYGNTYWYYNIFAQKLPTQ